MENSATPITIFSYDGHININKRPAYLPSQSKMLLISYIYNLKVIFQTRWFQWFDYTRNGVWYGVGDALPLLCLLTACWRCWVHNVYSFIRLTLLFRHCIPTSLVCSRNNLLKYFCFGFEFCFQGYRAIILQTLPQLRILDCKNIFGEPVNLEEINSSRLQCFEGLLDNLVSSDSPLNISEDEVEYWWFFLKKKKKIPSSVNGSEYEFQGSGLFLCHRSLTVWWCQWQHHPWTYYLLWSSSPAHQKIMFWPRSYLCVHLLNQKKLIMKTIFRMKWNFRN